jgi:hypothetical protein
LRDRSGEARGEGACNKVACGVVPQGAPFTETSDRANGARWIGAKSLFLPRPKPNFGTNTEGGLRAA